MAAGADRRGRDPHFSSWVIIAFLLTYSLFLQFDATYPKLSHPAAIALAV